MSLEAHLVELEKKHRRLDTEIEQETLHHADPMRLTKLKRQKLMLKEEITKLKGQLKPGTSVH
jgi:hypothetical protein